MRNEFIKRGEILPLIFPSSPNNPMGLYALYLENNYAIHGTNSNFGIGLRITRGCIRLRPKDIKSLFTLVPIGTRVQFINEPVKSTVEKNGTQYLEVHTPLCNEKEYDTKITIEKKLKENTYKLLEKNKSNIDYEIVEKALLEKNGIPVNITKKTIN